MKNIIEISGLSKSFGNQTILNDINVHIPTGKIYGIIGQSGVGKSTLLRCINGLETYDKGFLRVNGIEVKSLKGKELREFRRKIGVVFQNFSLLSSLNVEENISLPLRTWKYDKKFTKEKTQELIEMVGLSDKSKCYPSELSGGQKQRVAIARALTMSPQILLCDEATSALDPKTAKSIIELLKSINKKLGITILMVTHQMSVLREACEEIIILESGKIAASGSVEDIFIQQPKALKNLIGEKEFIFSNDAKLLKIILDSKNSNEPIITKMARDLDIDFKILESEFDEYRGKIMGTMIISIKNDQFRMVKQYLNSKEIVFEEI